MQMRIPFINIKNKIDNQFIEKFRFNKVDWNKIDFELIIKLYN